MRIVPRRWSVPFAVIGLLLACACGLTGRSALSALADEPTGPTSAALKGFDPVLLVAGKEVKGEPGISVTRAGFRYVFADAANKAKFEKDPERYEIQCKGQCATMQGTPADPDVFTVYKERIYGFACEDCREEFRRQPEKFVKRRSVAILIFEGMELLDFAGPAEVFVAAGFQVRTVAATKDPVLCGGLVTLTPNHTFADCPPADIIVIPGGRTAVSKDKRVTDWVVQASRETKATLSVCTGVFVLARAGLLDGKEATTHHGSIEALRKEFPKITVHADRRVVDNGKLVTAAGVSAGIDGALHLVDRLLGRSEAAATARYMEYNWQPPSQK
jgi:putative intracellular protease/amidase/YHS domain-containing protein